MCCSNISLPSFSKGASLALLATGVVLALIASAAILGLLHSYGVISFPPSLEWFSSFVGTIGHEALWVISIGGGVVAILCIALSSIQLGCLRKRNQEPLKDQPEVKQPIESDEQKKARVWHFFISTVFSQYFPELTQATLDRIDKQLCRSKNPNLYISWPQGWVDIQKQPDYVFIQESDDASPYGTHKLSYKDWKDVEWWLAKHHYQHA